MSDVQPYRLFNVALARKTRLSPHLTRLTFAGEEVAAMKTGGPDQRIKIFFPNEAGEPSALPDRPDWYSIYREVEPKLRAPMRTYTIRHLRAEQQEVDVDFVLHGETGPASRWALHAAPGDRVQMAAPNALYQGAPTGCEWNPPADLERLLLIADETALPAVAGILDELARLPKPPRTEAHLEIPYADDKIPLTSWPELDIHWLPREGASAGTMMMAAIRRTWLPELALAGAAPVATAFAEVDIDEQILWDRAAPRSSGFYAWAAGETAAVADIRKFLIKERQLDKSNLALMGYWREGKVRE